MLLLHSAGTGASQWRGVAERLEGQYRLLMPNLRGYGRTPAPTPGADPLAEEIAVVHRMVEIADAPVHLVGHSLGALLALSFAAQQPDMVSTLTLIEPIVVGVLREDGAAGDGKAARSLDDLGGMIRAFQAAVAQGDTAAAMRVFTEYWSGPGAWDAIPAAARLPFFARANKMAADVDLAWNNTAGREVFAQVPCPATVLTAARTTAAARDIAERLAGALPAATLGVIPEAGHMAPVTHPDVVAGLLSPREQS